MIETTLFKNDLYKNSESIYHLLSSYGFKVLLIANEINKISDKIHFHVLLDNTMDDIPKGLEDYIIFRPVRNVDKTITYFTKEGKYKTYNGFEVYKSMSSIDELELIKDLENNMTYLELFRKYGKAIRSYSYLIKQIKEESKEGY